jgi:hypothetical protein
MRKVSRVSRPALKRISSGGVVLALVALFGLPTAAFAAPGPTSAAIGPADTITVTTTADSVNRINISDTSEVVDISDTRQTETAGAGCSLGVGGDEILCPIDGITTVIVNLGDGDDQLSVFGSSLIFQRRQRRYQRWFWRRRSPGPRGCRRHQRRRPPRG